MNNFKVLMNGIIKENPTFVLLLGMCPTLGTTSSALNGMSMGLATTFVLVCSNVVISLIKNLIPDMVRIPAFIVVIASFVTALQMCMQAFVPDIYATLGLFIPLIVVNCIILGRAEAFASKNGVVPSFFDGVGMGLGFTIALTVLGAVREILGTGKIFGLEVWPEDYGMLMFVLAPGAFIVLGYLIAIVNKLKKAYFVNLEQYGSNISVFNRFHYRHICQQRRVVTNPRYLSVPRRIQKNQYGLRHVGRGGVRFGARHTGDLLVAVLCFESAQPRLLADHSFYPGHCGIGATGGNHPEKGFPFALPSFRGIPTFDYYQLCRPRCGHIGYPKGIQSDDGRMVCPKHCVGLRTGFSHFRRHPRATQPRVRT